MMKIVAELIKRIIRGPNKALAEWARDSRACLLAKMLELILTF